MTNRAKTLDDVANDRWRISIFLTAIMMVIYFGFILLIAYNKTLLATSVVPGLSLGILLGALTIVAVWVLTYIYVNWANNTYDLHVAELQAKLRIDATETLTIDEITKNEETNANDRNIERQMEGEA